MKNGEAEALINYLVEYLENSLSEISESKNGGSPCGEFLTGEAYAFTECLEIILSHMGVSAEELLEREKRYGVA